MQFSFKSAFTIDKDAGYIDPKTKAVRTIPLELFYKDDKEPVYGITSDDDNRATETKALPFQAFGALGMVLFGFWFLIFLILIYFIISG